MCSQVLYLSTFSLKVFLETLYANSEEYLLKSCSQLIHTKFALIICKRYNDNNNSYLTVEYLAKVK